MRRVGWKGKKKERNYIGRAKQNKKNFLTIHQFHHQVISWVIIIIKVELRVKKVKINAGRASGDFVATRQFIGKS